MNNKETADAIRRWCHDRPGLAFSWPTDACGYDQHMAFVVYRNKHWTDERAKTQTFDQFCGEYADMLERSDEGASTGD